MIKNIYKLQKLQKIKFKNESLLIEALTHKSTNKNFNNEKLEFLGDRVIGLILSKKLIDLYPSEKVGVLDKRFAILVNRETCSDIAWSIGVQNYILMGNQKKITRKDKKILSDCCEAIIGAVYVDRGYDFAKNYVLKIWKKNIDKSDITILDSKTKLQEYSLKNYRKLPIYRLMNSSGPRHKPIYKISVSINGSKEFIGTGGSKQQAEQSAATKLIKDKNIN